MAKKQMIWKTKGMNQDLSISAFNPEFSFENRNLRLSTNEGNTLMSWVNEKGTSSLSLQIPKKSWNSGSFQTDTIVGTAIGTAILNDKLVLFTTTESGTAPDYIYVLYYNNTKTVLIGQLLYNGNLNFDTNYPLETLVSYEAEHIQKVYWTDGKNQPRVINIAASENKITKWNSITGECHIFDFIPTIAMNEEITITKNIIGGGIFEPGTIQYAFTYINRYGQQSNIIYLSPIQYLAYSDRGASPEQKVSCSFQIQIANADQSFDYVRIYSIQRTSLNATPYVKQLADVSVNGTTPSELFQRTVVYSNDNSLTLPRDNNGKILTAQVVRGSYTVSVTPISIASGVYAQFNNNAELKIIAYNAQTQEEDLMTWQELFDKIFYRDYPLDYQEFDYKVYDYHVEIQIDQALDTYLTDLARAAGYDNWGIKVNGATYKGDSHTGFSTDKFVYNYADKKWYITASAITETVTKDEIIGGQVITFTDNGTLGAVIDPTELLFVGGKEIKALTMMDKDNTLFLGNLRWDNLLVRSIQDYYDSLRKSNPNDPMGITYENDGVYKQMTLNHSDGVYVNTNNLNWNQRQISTFKGGETYRFGFQLQKATGEWSEPIFMNDVTNVKYPSTSLYSDIINLVYARANINMSAIGTYIGGFDYNVYKKIRPVIVFPTIGDRSVVCQGVLNPTLFNVQDRVDNSPFAQASWYFRPYMVNGSGGGDAPDINVDDYVSFTSTTPLPSNMDLDPDTNTGGYFLNHQYLMNVSVLVADVLDDQDDSSIDWRAHSPLSTGKVIYWFLDEYQGDPDPRTDYSKSGYGEYDILGAIKLGAGATYGTVTSKRYAFLCKDMFDVPCDSTANYDDGAVSRQQFEYTNVHYLATSKVWFKAYGDFKGTPSFLYYMKPDTDAPDHFFLKFYAADANTGYEAYVVVDFESAGNSSGYFPSKADTQGTPVRYQHYDYIFAQSEVTSTTGYNNNYYDEAKQVEIQGSKNVYSKVGGNSAVFNSFQDTSKCNSQFFIDQSIVTLNSPEIEFDTDIQNYNTEGLKLRIVGAIPITANVSAHSIITSPLEIENLHTEAAGTKTGTGEKNDNIIHYNISQNGGRRLVSELLWNDVPTVLNGDFDEGFYTSNPRDFYVHPWHRSGSMANDKRSNEEAGSVLQKKKESNLLFSLNTEFFSDVASLVNIGSGTDSSGRVFKNLNYQTLLTENAEIINTRLPKQKKTSSEINYYPNIDKVITNVDGYKCLGESTSYPFNQAPTVYSPVSIKYKSTSHAVLAFNAPSNETAAEIPLLPYAIEGSTNFGKYTNPENTPFPKTFWEDTQMRFSQGGMSMDSLFINNSQHVSHNFLWLGELYKDVTNRFGGKSREAVRNNTWLIAGDPVSLTDSQGDPLSSVPIVWTLGDTYFQRYDCLKTYAYTNEDTNQLVEILSFLCETHVNIDGRYDRNRGQMDNTNMSPVNFNKLNPVYSQMDNYFGYKKLDDEQKSLVYPNQITFTKTKSSGADVDLWTNITLASTLELDGDKGVLNSIRRFNNQLIAFQDTGISQILYNESVQISSTEGVPIEIANSEKVQGKRYISNAVGCSNKWAIANTPAGIYFMDSYNKGIYLFNGQLTDLSSTLGFNSWAKKNIPTPPVKWTPDRFENFVAYYDKQNQDVLFINKQEALAYSEKLGMFTSFYDYGNTSYLCNLKDTGVWVKPTGSSCGLWKNQGGNYYCNFFGVPKSYEMTLIGNPEPQLDKIFTNLEFKATVDTDGTISSNQFTPLLPFDCLETWNEYQHGLANLSIKNGSAAMKHHTLDNSASLKRKFRIWRCDIPRDNAELTLDSALGISRFAKHPIDRMRNPWIYVKLKKNAAEAMKRAEVHDIELSYFS